MRILLSATLFAVLLGASTAQAEKRVFILTNSGDEYGVDRCLAAGASCGNAVATAYCKSHEFELAVSFRKVDKDEITGAIPTQASVCHGRSCGQLVAIECSR
jgi:hypothetical protein